MIPVSCVVSPNRRGLLTSTLSDLAEIRPRLSVAMQEVTDQLAAEFRTERDALDPVLEEVCEGTPFHL